MVLSLKVDVPNSAAYLNWTPTFEQYVVRCGSKNRHQKGICLMEIGLCVQNMIPF